MHGRVPDFVPDVDVRARVHEPLDLDPLPPPGRVVEVALPARRLGIDVPAAVNVLPGPVGKEEPGTVGVLAEVVVSLLLLALFFWEDKRLYIAGTSMGNLFDD